MNLKSTNAQGTKIPDMTDLNDELHKLLDQQIINQNIFIEIEDSVIKMIQNIIISLAGYYFISLFLYVNFFIDFT